MDVLVLSLLSLYEKSIERWPQKLFNIDSHGIRSILPTSDGQRLARKYCCHSFIDIHSIVKL